jgi:hypothetical protein
MATRETAFGRQRTQGRHAGVALDVDRVADAGQDPLAGAVLAHQRGRRGVDVGVTGVRSQGRHRVLQQLGAELHRAEEMVAGT